MTALCESDRTEVERSGMPPDRAKTVSEHNDTSVIRGPAMMKAGRWDSYGPVRQTGVWCAPGMQASGTNSIHIFE